MTPLDGIDPARTLIDAERLDDYLDALRREGFAVGIDERLRSWRLVSAFVRRGAGAEERPTLRVMLASLLSRSAEELRRAQDVFDGMFAREAAGGTEALPSSRSDPLPVVPPPSGGWIKDKAKLLAVVLGLLVLLVGIFFYSRIPPAPEPPKPCISKCGDETTPPPTTEPLPQPDATWTLATVIADLQTRSDPRTAAPLSAAPTLREASRAGWPPSTLTDGRRLSLAEFVARTGLEPDIPLDFDDQAIRASLATGLGLSAAGNEQLAISPSLFHRLVEALRAAGGEFTSLPTGLAERANLARSRLPPNISQSTNQDELRGAGDDLIDRALFTAFPQIRSNPVFDRASWAAGIVTSAAPAPSWLPLLVVPPPLLVLIWLLFRRRDLRKSYLRARAPNAQPLVRNVAVERPPDTVYNRSQFTRSAQALHARQQRLAFGIDPDATVEATARAGGLFTKVDGVITSTPAYVVLIEIKTMADHEARRLDRLVGRLKQAGVEIERFFYFGTAEYLYPEIDLSADPNAPSGLKPRPIEEVAAAFFEARLIIMGEAHGFLDPVTLKARSWTQILLAWSSRTLLTPRPFRAWDIREAALAKELDLPLGRATQEGLAALGDLLCLEGQDEAPAYSVRFPPEGDIRDIPNRIALEPHRWLSNRAPDDKEWTTLRRSLLYYHDRGAYLWLCVAAVYPALLWDLTIYLGLTLKDGENSLYDERRLAALARLPWFREHGMPAWLRVKLRDELKHDHPALYEQAIVLLWSLLASDLAAKEAASTTSLRIARDLNAPNSGQRPFADEIFLDTMVDGTIPEDALPLSHAAQRHLAQLLGTVGKRDMLSIIVTSLLAVAAWWLVPKPSDGPLVPGAFLPITVLGILAILAGLAFAIYDHGVPTWAEMLKDWLHRFLPRANEGQTRTTAPAGDARQGQVRPDPNAAAQTVGDDTAKQPTEPGLNTGAAVDRRGIFICYSHKDQAWLDEFRTYIAPLARRGKIDLWDDTRIAPGVDWKMEIEEAIRTSRIAVLLVTPNFLASDFITNVELPAALSARAEGRSIFWIPVMPTLYELTALENIQAASDPRKPLAIMSESERGEAWVSIARRLARAMAQDSATPDTPPQSAGQDARAQSAATARARDLKAEGSDERPIFSSAEVQRIFDVLLRLDFMDDTKISVLLSGLPNEYIALIPRDSAPAIRLQLILQTLNRSGAKIGGHVPFYYVLKNIEAMFSWDPEVTKIMPEFLGRLAQREARDASADANLAT